MKHAYAGSANTYIDNFAMFNVSYSKANVTASYNASHGVNFTAMNEVPAPPAVITNSSWNYTNTNIISGENTKWLE